MPILHSGQSATDNDVVDEFAWLACMPHEGQADGYTPAPARGGNTDVLRLPLDYDLAAQVADEVNRVHARAMPQTVSPSAPVYDGGSKDHIDFYSVDPKGSKQGYVRRSPVSTPLSGPTSSAGTASGSATLHVQGLYPLGDSPPGYAMILLTSCTSTSCDAIFLVPEAVAHLLARDFLVCISPIFV